MTSDTTTYVDPPTRVVKPVDPDFLDQHELDRSSFTYQPQSTNYNFKNRHISIDTNPTVLSTINPPPQPPAPSSSIQNNQNNSNNNNNLSQPPIQPPVQPQTQLQT